MRHEPQKWATEGDYRQQDLMLALTQPSTPLVHCLKYRIPLVIVSRFSEYHAGELFHRTCNNIHDFPFLVTDLDAAVALAKSILLQPGAHEAAQDRMGEYEQRMFADGRALNFGQVVERALTGTPGARSIKGPEALTEEVPAGELK